MSNIVDLAEYRRQKEEERRREEMRRPCTDCDLEMNEVRFETDLHQGSEVYYICPSCFNFRIDYEVTE